MTKIKLCGLTRKQDIHTANKLKPDYIGFVFAKKSRRYLPLEKAAELKKILNPEIKAVGVFVNEEPSAAAKIAQQNIIDVIQLHGDEDEEYIDTLRRLTDAPVIQAFKIRSKEDIQAAEKSSADCVLLDGGAGDGKPFDWDIIKNIKKTYFLAGGLDAKNAADAIKALRPYALDVSSGIETDGKKDTEKMAAFVAAVREEI